MKTLRWCASFLFIIFTFLFISSRAFTQPACTPPETRARIIIQNAKGGIDTVWIGFDSTATYCSDLDLCDSDTPQPPPGLSFFFPTLRNDCSWGGTQQDYRPFVDTTESYNLAWGYGIDSTYFPITLRWQKQIFQLLCDSIRMSDYFGLFSSVNMALEDSLVISNELFQQVNIKLFGAKKFYETTTCTPPIIRTWIKAEDNRGQKDTLWFGFDPNATCGVEPFLCEFKVVEICGPPTNLACYYWLVENCGSHEGFGLPINNYRTLKTQAQVDTFTLRFSGEYPFTFSWSADSVAKIADSIIVTDALGINLFRFRMDQQDSFIVSSFHHALNLITYRSGITDIVNPNENIPASFELKQNYPNPFNPLTNFEFQIANRGFVTLKIFNLLGEEIAAIVSESLQPGSYSRTWDASSASSGVYYYRLSAGAYIQTKKMLLIK